MDKATISIIIIAYNEEKYLPVLLSSLAEQTNTNFEVIISDSNSSDNTEAVAMDFKDSYRKFRYLKLDAAKGPAYGRNKGAELANHERLLFLDADTRFKKDFIERSITELNTKKADVAGCPIRIAEGHALSNFGAFILNMFMTSLRPVYTSAYGACFFSTRTVHAKVGGFDENLGICEDCNYAKKARRKYNFKFTILHPYFYTSDRRAKSEGSILFMLKYLGIHIYRMFTGKEFRKEDIRYDYGNF